MPAATVTVPGHTCGGGVTRNVMCFHLDGKVRVILAI